MEEQERLYHHTRYEVLEQIIKEDGVSLRGSYFEKFNNEDYEWTKDKCSPIIKKICEDKGYEYSDDSPYQPIIISFCKESNSGYMWENYADNYKGIQIILDYEKVASSAYDKLDYLDECVYIEGEQEIEDYLRNHLRNLRQICVNDYQYNLEALSGFIKKPNFAVESEIRYIHAWPYMFKVHPDRQGGCVIEETKPDKDDKECYVLFPKKALLGLSLGCESEHTLEEVRSLLHDRGYNIDEIELKLQKRNVEV